MRSPQDGGLFPSGRLRHYVIGIREANGCAIARRSARTRATEIFKDWRFEIALVQYGGFKPPLLVWMNSAISRSDSRASGTNGVPNCHPCGTPWKIRN
jgi:hypothetical protein